MAPIALEEPTASSTRVLEKPWSRPKVTSEKLDWADLPMIDLSRFDEPGGKRELANQLYDAVTKVGFWSVVNTGIDDERVLRQFSIGNTFFKEPLEEKRRFPCNFADGEYFGYRENSRWVGDTGIKENIEMVSCSWPADPAKIPTADNMPAQYPQGDTGIQRCRKTQHRRGEL